MKVVRTVVKSTVVVLFLFFIGVFSSLIYVSSCVSDSYYISKGESLEIQSAIPVRISYESESLNAQTDNNGKSGLKMELKVLGIIPVKSIDVKVVEDNYVSVLGTPFGIKIYTEGVLVVDFSEIDAEEGDKNPAKSAGLRVGDFIVSLNGNKVYTNEDVAEIIKNSNGESVVARIIRNGKKRTISFYPAKSKSTGIYRAGIWVKDSSAGIGTMTFYSPKYNVVAGLGHGICDSDTGTLLSLNSGQFVTADIVSYVKGKAGSAGELKGVFSGKSIANFLLNTNKGVYGNVNCDITLDNMMPIALKQDVRNSKAYILSTIDGNKPEYYTCNVKIRNYDETQNLLVEITDERLLKTTGGIVQGMSGSPIIQNGKLIGAVTHVLIDDPTKGYAIFAENMLETAQSVAESNKLKEAS